MTAGRGFEVVRERNRGGRRQVVRVRQIHMAAWECDVEVAKQLPLSRRPAAMLKPLMLVHQGWFAVRNVAAPPFAG